MFLFISTAILCASPHISLFVHPSKLFQVNPLVCRLVAGWRGGSSFVGCVLDVIVISFCWLLWGMLMFFLLFAMLAILRGLSAKPLPVLLWYSWLSLFPLYFVAMTILCNISRVWRVLPSFALRCASCLYYCSLLPYIPYLQNNCWMERVIVC